MTPGPSTEAPSVIRTRLEPGETLTTDTGPGCGDQEAKAGQERTEPEAAEGWPWLSKRVSSRNPISRNTNEFAKPPLELKLSDDE